MGAYERMVARLDTQGECRVWTGAKNSDGYGVIRADDRRLVLTHRLAFEHANGPMPPGLVTDHVCRTRLCARLDHLEAVTQYENCHRGLWGGYWREYREERARQEAALDAMAIGYRTERQDILDRGLVKLITLTEYITNLKGASA